MSYWNSTIKPKRGPCPICEEEGDTSDKVLINKLCTQHNEQVKRSKQKSKNTQNSCEPAIKLGGSRSGEKTEGRNPQSARKIRQKSDKLAKEERLYHTYDKPEYMGDHPHCEAGLPGCTYYATDIHHKKGRGIWLRVKEYFMAVCRHCHDWIEAHPKEAKKRGWVLSRLGKHFIK